MTAPARRSRRFAVGFALFLAVLGLGAWAAARRILGPGRAAAPTAAELAKIAYRPLPYVNYGLKPSWTRQGDLRRTSNALGFRGREVETPKPAGRYRLACIGGSTTYDDKVHDEEAYPVRLEAFLRAARPARDVEVVNAGVPSYTTAENVANLALRVVDLQPDAIVLYEGINDWRARPYRNFDRAYFHFRKVWDGGVDEWLPGDGDMADGLNPLIQHDLPGDNGDPMENARRAGIGAFSRNLLTMAGIARAHGIAVVMVSNTVDHSNPYATAAFLEAMAETNRAVRDACERTGSLFIDLDAAFPKGGAYPEGGLFVDPVHNNARGAELKARIVADALLAGPLK